MRHRGKHTEERKNIYNMGFKGGALVVLEFYYSEANDFSILLLIWLQCYLHNLAIQNETLVIKS